MGPLCRSGGGSHSSLLSLHLHRAIQQSSFEWPRAYADPQEEIADDTVAHYEESEKYIAGKITWICSDLDAVVDTSPVNTTLALLVLC